MAKESQIMPEDEEMTVVLDLDDGSVTCRIFTIFTVEKQDYIALLPLDKNGEYTSGDVWIYRYSENPDDPNEEPVIDNILDEDEYERVEEAFDEYLDSCEYDELVEDEEDEE